MNIARLLASVKQNECGTLNSESFLFLPCWNRLIADLNQVLMLMSLKSSVNNVQMSFNFALTWAFIAGAGNAGNISGQDDWEEQINSLFTVGVLYSRTLCDGKKDTAC